MVFGNMPDLLHEHVDVGLSSIQDIAMWVRQTLHSDLHGLSINVDPTRCSTSQESPTKKKKVTQNVTSAKMNFKEQPFKCCIHAACI